MGTPKAPELPLFRVFSRTLQLSQHPPRTAQVGKHGVTEVAKTTNIAKMAEKCISSRPIPPHANPMESAPGNTFRLRIEKN